MGAADIAAAFIIGLPLYLTGFTGNALVILAVWKKASLRAIPNYLLVNIAVSDIVALVFIPFPLLLKLVKLDHNRVLADYLCKFLLLFNIPITSVFASIFTVTVMSVERYNAVIKPLKRGIRLQEENVKFAVIAIWLGAILVSLPSYLDGAYVPDSNRCGHDQTQLPGIDKEAYRITEVVIAVTSVTVSFGIITFCYFNIAKDFYFKQKVASSNLGITKEVAKLRTVQTRQTVKLSLTITLLFVICVFPVLIITCLKVFEVPNLKKPYNYSGFVFFAMTCLNPFIHCYQSSQFREAFKDILGQCCHRPRTG
ncbi:somatostatin receptor type 5-like [Exaiptasia diaphana]|uniref:G-protein coupled receptors family 1 profile domain-containing protein n=1 Tax=Exaiptasia diaphana TaxID=2652724 RepID=A0A913X9U4_EXADI|nr:somatostatin receptor type 5-like [Exaiptasia diaphana]